MNKWISVFLILVVATGCAKNSVQETIYDNTNKDQQVIEIEDVSLYEKITAEEAKDLMNEEVIVLDVRTKEEFEQGHIEAAILLPVDDIMEGKTEVLADKEQTILVYCRSGNRSEKAARALIDLGYKEVYDFGGITDWPYDIVTD